MARAPKAKRYAQALFALAQDRGKQQAWLDDLSNAVRLLDDPDVELFLTTPRIPAARKLRGAEELLHGADPMVLNLVGLLIARHSVDLVPDITEAYRVLLDESLGRVHATVTSAVAVSPEQQQQLRASLGTALGQDVVLDLNEDTEIIGGLMVRVGDQIIDGTVRSRLDMLRTQLLRGSLR